MRSDVLLQFLKPGLQTLVQDLGRAGHQAQGVPVGGALDQTAARVANWLVSNPPETPVLEITFMGPQLTITGTCQLALTGADLAAELNGQPAPRYQTLTVPDDATLSFGRLVSGCRAYLAVGGTWAVRPWLGSCSALPHGAAATPDSFIRKGSGLRIVPRPLVAPKTYAAALWPVLPASVRVRVVPGPELDVFSQQAVGYFFSRRYRLTPDANRMGCRLHSEGVADLAPDHALISSGIVPGTVQITRSGQPVILLADAQTTGGYCRIANVLSADLDKLAQLKPGDEVTFALVSMAEAQAALLAQRQHWQALT